MFYSGGIAQLGERLNGIQEVSGSIPRISTTVNFGHAFAWPLVFLTPSVKQTTALRSRLSPPPGNPPWNCVPGLFIFFLQV